MSRREFNRRMPRTQTGFTLIEVMIVVVIVAVLLSLVAPSFVESLQRNRRLAALQDTLTMIASARSEAVSRSTAVAVCPSNDGRLCSGTGNWEEGVLLFQDDGVGTDGVANDTIRNGDEALIRAFGAAGPGVTLRSGGSFTNPKGILFNQLGTVFETGTIIVCGEKGVKSAVAVVLNQSGQPRLAVDRDGSEIVNDDAGFDLGACP